MCAEWYLSHKMLLNDEVKLTWQQVTILNTRRFYWYASELNTENSSGNLTGPPS